MKPLLVQAELAKVVSVLVRLIKKSG